jgi:hypothetical protein
MGAATVHSQTLIAALWAGADHKRQSAITITSPPLPDTGRAQALHPSRRAAREVLSPDMCKGMLEEAPVVPRPHKAGTCMAQF